MFDHSSLPAGFAGVPGIFIPFTGLTAEDIAKIVALAGLRPEHDEEVPESAPVRPTPPPPDLSVTRNSSQPAAASASVKWELSEVDLVLALSLIHISEPTRRT